MILWAIAAATPNVGRTASFVPLGSPDGGLRRFVASAISGDGSTIVGTFDPSGGHESGEAYTWTRANGFRGLGDLPGGITSSEGEGISHDGSVVVGFGFSEFGEEAFRWTEEEGLVGLGDLPGGRFISRAQAVSADGSIVVGFGESDFFVLHQAVMWNSADQISVLDGTLDRQRAYAISGDGSVILGSGTSGGFVWNGDNVIAELGTFPAGTAAYPAASSFDGSVIAGSVISPSDRQAFVWSSEGGLRGLGDLGDGSLSSSASALSYDGRVIAGSIESDSGRTAFVWNESEGMQSLEVLLQTLGVDLDGWKLAYAIGISGDGKSVLGYGFNPMGDLESFVAVIPQPQTAVLLGFGLFLLGLPGCKRGTL